MGGRVGAWTVYLTRPASVPRERGGIAGPVLVCASMHRLFRCRDPRDHGFGETVHARPRIVPDTVLVRGHIHHIAAPLGAGYLVVALLVGDADQAIALAVRLRHGLAELGPAGRLP